MLLREACRTLQQELQRSGQALNRLDPWEAWRVFKAFLVRQFSERAPDDGADEPIGRLIVELRYAAAHFRSLEATDLWTLDFPSLEEWASVVEGQASFQESMARTPLITEVYYEEGGAEGA